MSFLDNVKAKATGANNAGANNPFATNSTANNPFAPKPATSTATSMPKPTAPAFAAPTAAPSMPKPSAPIGAPAPGMAKPAAPKAPSFVTTPVAPTPVEEPKNVTTEELVNDIKNAVAEESVKAETKEEKVETKAEAKEEVKVEAKEEVVEEVKAEVKEEKPKAKAKPRATKKKAEPKAKAIVDEPINEVEAEMVENVFKLPTTNMKYADAIKAVSNRFVDQEWEDFRTAMIAEADQVVIESDMQEGAIKKAIEQLNRLRDKIWVHFCDTKSILENLSSKETEGLIETVKFASLEGSNETSRKKAAVLAVMNYRTPEGDVVNLYEMYYETRSRFIFLKGLMDTVEYKSRVLITMSSALKMQKGM